MAWLVVESPESEPFWYDVVPAVVVDGENMMSAAHTQGEHCDCRPRRDEHRDGFPIWFHHDPEADEVEVKQ